MAHDPHMIRPLHHSRLNQFYSSTFSMVLQDWDVFSDEEKRMTNKFVAHFVHAKTFRSPRIRAMLHVARVLRRGGFSVRVTRGNSFIRATHWADPVEFHLRYRNHKSTLSILWWPEAEMDDRVVLCPYDYQGFDGGFDEATLDTSTAPEVVASREKWLNASDRVIRLLSTEFQKLSRMERPKFLNEEDSLLIFRKTLVELRRLVEEVEKWGTSELPRRETGAVRGDDEEEDEEDYIFGLLG